MDSKKDKLKNTIANSEQKQGAFWQKIGFL